MAIQSLRTIGLPVLAVQSGDNTPDPGGQGWAWSSTLSQPVFWDGSRWRSVTPIHVGTTAPSNPATGQLWVDTN